MTGWREIDREKLAGGSELALYQKGGSFMIRADGLELMTSEAVRSEEDFVRFGLEALSFQPSRVLIGGLGLGFTLGATARALPEAEIVVAEISPAILRWLTGPARNSNSALLEEARIHVEIEDVQSVMARAAEDFDLILLDVDNGPEALVHDDNVGLYSSRGIAAAARALSPGGGLVYWSAFEAPWFAERLSAAGLEVRARSMAMPDAPRVHHTHYIAVKPLAADRPSPG